MATLARTAIWTFWSTWFLARATSLLRVSGLAEELGELLDVRVDVVAATLLRHEVSASALVDAVAV